MCRTKYIFAQGGMKRRALPYPEILLCPIEFRRKKLLWTPFHCQITTYYLVRHMRGTASELGLKARLHRRFLSRNSMQFLSRRSCNFNIARVNQLRFQRDFIAAISQEFRTCSKPDAILLGFLMKMWQSWIRRDPSGGFVARNLYSHERTVRSCKTSLLYEFK